MALVLNASLNCLDTLARPATCYLFLFPFYVSHLEKVGQRYMHPPSLDFAGPASAIRTEKSTVLDFIFKVE